MPNISSIIKNVRNIMRNEDQGISGDAQRLEQLGWMLFLKIIDDNHLDKLVVENLANERFGKGVKLMNKLEASGLIEELLETHSAPQRNGNQPHRNGNGNGRPAPRS